MGRRGAHRVLIRGGTIVTMNPYRDVLRDHDLLVEGVRIRAMGPLGSVGLYVDVDDVINAGGRVEIPGLTQTHIHLCQTLFRNLVANKDLAEWLGVIIPLEAAHDRDSNFWSAMLGIAELLLGGTTALYDFGTTYFTDSTFEAMAQTGIRGFAGKRMVDLELPGSEAPPGVLQPTDLAFGEGVALFEEWDRREGGRLRYCFCLGTPSTSTKKLLELTAEISHRCGAHVHIHTAETVGAERATIDLTGMRDIVCLDSVGLVTPRIVCAHCVHLNRREIESMARCGGNVAHCPQANLYLASGIAPIPEMIARGVNIGIGADAAADNNSMDAFQEMKLAASLQKGLHMDPTIQPDAQRAFEMATLGGARSLGLEREIGSIEVGKRADLAILDLRKPHAWPNEPEVNSPQHIYTRIVYSARAKDVVLTMVDGRVLMRDRKLLTMNLREVLKESNAAVMRVIERSGLSL